MWTDWRVTNLLASRFWLAGLPAGVPPPLPFDPVKIVPFAEEHLDAAGVLLAERHRRHRKVEPLLPERFEDPAVARAEIEAALADEGAVARAALVAGQLAAYLVASPRVASWGRNMWVGLAGQAASDPELVRDLYADVAGKWVDAGLDAHYAIVPASDTDLLEAWYLLSFGQQQAQAIQAVPEVDPPAPAGVEVREATDDDLDALVDLDFVLPAHQHASPVFGGGELPNAEEIRADWADGVRSLDEGILLALHEGRPVGSLSVAPVKRSGMHVGLSRPDGACILGFAATLPEARGLGAGLALTAACFRWAREHGYGTIVVDYRTANREASRFWPRRGFRPTFLRLFRSVP